MTNTYEDTAPNELKKIEELRCIRCVLERILMYKYPAGFNDYQMEKFGNAPKQVVERTSAWGDGDPGLRGDKK